MKTASTARWARSWRAAYVALLTSLLWGTADARAQAPLLLERLQDEVRLEDRVDTLLDPSGKLTFAEVRSRDSSFVANEGRSLSLGFDYAALWLRFSVRNDGSSVHRWLLEIAEPTLDHVDLYAVHQDGRSERRHGGDALPFASRAVPHGNLVFELQNTAKDQATYYVRVQSNDFLHVPIRAWSPSVYAAHHERDVLLHAWCIGALLAVALYHFGVFALVRQVENIWFALVALSLCTVLMGNSGTIGQLFLPHHPQLANRAHVMSVALALLTISFFTYAATEQLKTQPKLSRVLLYVALSTSGLVALGSFAPVGLALRAFFIVLLAVCLGGPFVLHAVRSYNIPELGLYSVGWYALIISIPVTVLRYAGVWPDGPVSRWALAAGFIFYGVANSLALAALASRLRRELATMNERLFSNVAELKQALVHAEQANDKALRATKAKDEFVATMSHELRTPLNMIINIPQGLVTEFETVRYAVCGHCDADFFLDADDRIDAATVCESCSRYGTLVEGKKVRFRGDEARCLHFLKKIERSGQHLLQMVNGVLDYSKLEAGHFQLELAPVDVDALLREVSDQMIDIAVRKNIRLEIDSLGDMSSPLLADGLRLKQVLINLVANAIKFSEVGSTVAVRWTSLPDSQHIEVEDRGIGIAKANHERIFSSFEQVHKGDTRKYGGTGLGLSISRSLVRMHGGELSVRSDLGHGSIFLIRLPRLPAQLSSELRVLPERTVQASVTG